MNTFDKYRDSCLFYIKLDLALIAAFATAVTVLKLDRPEILDTLDDFYYALIALVIFLVLGLFIERIILFRGFSSNSSKEVLNKLFKTFLLIQTFLHTGLFFFIIGFGRGALDSRKTFRTQEHTIELVKAATLEFFNHYAVLPKNKNQLISSSSFLRAKQVDSSQFLFNYNIIDSLNYIITLPGSDKKLETQDDWIRWVVMVNKNK